MGGGCGCLLFAAWSAGCVLLRAGRFENLEFEGLGRILQAAVVDAGALLLCAADETAHLISVQLNVETSKLSDKGGWRLDNVWRHVRLPKTSGNTM